MTIAEAREMSKSLPEPQPGEHRWVVLDFIGYPTCWFCGIVKRKDGKNKPCQGKVRMRPLEPIGFEKEGG